MDRDAEPLKFSHTTHRNVDGAMAVADSLAIPYKLSVYLPHDSAARPRYSPKRH